MQPIGSLFSLAANLQLAHTALLAQVTQPPAPVAVINRNVSVAAGSAAAAHALGGNCTVRPCSNVWRVGCIG